jgi:hypothetical protein
MLDTAGIVRDACLQKLTSELFVTQQRIIATAQGPHLPKADYTAR